jgi:hypothetical protein
VTYGYWQRMVRLAVECADTCKGSIAGKGLIAIPGFAWNVLALIAPMESRPDLETMYGPAPKMEYTPGAYVIFDAESWEKYVAPLRKEVGKEGEAFESGVDNFSKEKLMARERNWGEWAIKELVAAGIVSDGPFNNEWLREKLSERIRWLENCGE